MAKVQHVNIAQWPEFDEVLDVRSPSEFAEDHIPGAINVPVLDDDERARVGTLYVQSSPFEARKVGAALIARNIANHIEQYFSGRPKTWRPLVYCWRGGQRSGAMAHILSQVGWTTGQLEGGYKAYRKQVRLDLQSLPAQFSFIVVCGPTGSGKSRLLQSLSTTGAQVLDLESLAQHRGSLLGNLPGLPQPSQKCFETRLWDVLRKLDSGRLVFVEAESRKIGVLSLPDGLLEAIRKGNCVCIDAGIEARANLLLEDYRHFLSEPSLLFEKLDQLTPLHGRETLQHWRQMADDGKWQQLATDLLKLHYDPAYLKSTHSNFVHYSEATILQLSRLDHASLLDTAQTVCSNLKRCTSI